MYWTVPSPKNLPRSPVRNMISPASNGLRTNFSDVKSGARQYPAATFWPEMQISPTCPIGTISNCSSSTYTALLVIGLPMGTRPRCSEVCVTSWHVTSPATSVEPYKFSSVHLGRMLLNLCASDASRTSPLTVTIDRDRPICSPSSSITSNMAPRSTGTTTILLISCRSIDRSRA